MIRSRPLEPEPPLRQNHDRGAIDHRGWKHHGWKHRGSKRRGSKHRGSKRRGSKHPPAPRCKLLQLNSECLAVRHCQDVPAAHDSMRAVVQATPLSMHAS